MSLQDLAAALEASGLAAFLAAFPPHSTRRERWRRALQGLDPPLAATVRLLALGEPVDADALPAAVAEALPALVELGFAELDREARLRDLVLGRPLGIWLLATPAGLVAEHYFGPDSIALAMHATCRQDARCLDLCAGTAFQGLAALARCRSAVLVEIDPETARLAAVNVALNGAERRADVRCGDLFAPLANERFDHVIANVPFIAVPVGCPFPLAGSGGSDGFEVGRRVLADLWRHLEPAGSAHLAALLLRGGDRLLVADELAAWAADHDCAVHVTLTGTMPLGPGSALVRGTAAAIAAYGGSDDCADAEAAVAANYATLGARSASWAFLRIDRSARGLRVLDLGGANPLGPWLSLS